MPREMLGTVYKFLRMHAHQTVMLPVGGPGGGDGGLSVFDSARQWLLGDAPAGAAAGPSGGGGGGGRASSSSPLGRGGAPPVSSAYEGAVKASPLAPPLLTQAAAVLATPIGLQSSSLPCAWAAAVPLGVYSDRAAALCRRARGPEAAAAAADATGSGGGVALAPTGFGSPAVAAGGSGGGGGGAGGAAPAPAAPLFAPSLFMDGAAAAAPSHRLLWHQVRCCCCCCCCCTLLCASCADSACAAVCVCVCAAWSGVFAAVC